MEFLENIPDRLDWSRQHGWTPDSWRNAPLQLGWKPSGGETQPEQSWNTTDTINLPPQLEWVSNKEEFVDVFGQIKSWYREKFSDEELSNIKGIWNSWCIEYWWKLNNTKKLILSNRIDKYIFGNRNKDFVDIDKSIIRTMNNVSQQRKFREVAINLKTRLNVSNFWEDAKKIIKAEFLKAKNKSTIPNIDHIVQLLDHIDVVIASEPYQYWIPHNLSVPMAPTIQDNDLQAYKDMFVWWNIVPDHLDAINKNLNQVKYLLGNSYGMMKKSEKYDIDQVLLEVSYEYSCWEFTWEWDLYIILLDRLEKEDSTSLWMLYSNMDVNDINDDELYRDDSEIFTEENLKDIDYLVNEKWFDEEHARWLIIKYNILSKKIENKEELKEDEEQFYFQLCVLFGKDWQWWYARRSRKLKEIRDLQIRQAQEIAPRSVRSSVEYATWNIKDIRPTAIIENHEGIRDYVYWDVRSTPEVDVDDISFPSLSNDYKEDLLKKLISRNRSDPDFMDSIKYLDRIGNIDKEKAAADNIDEGSLENNRLKIERMILDLAREEALAQWEKSRINDVYVRKSSMICCFRAISKFFDTVNNNWENFASEFEIGDLNNDIKFDEATWIISMEWTIWANKNHIKLYYNTQTWTLEFDNFLAYDSQDNSFKIWKWNWKRERMNITLPTMDEMERQAQSINFGLIDRLSINTRQYEHMVWLAMWESIWFNCFKWFMGVDMEVNRYFVEQFNEKNILKQDIINTIYSKFYKQEDINEKLNGCLTINEWNEPEQFKLIKLISDTIDNCWSSNSLLRFRNAINWLDEILTNNHELVRDDVLLQYLFGDNLSNNGDVTDASRRIFEQENEDVAISKDINNFATYQSDDRHENNWDKTINYNLFFDLLSENRFGERVINIDCFETTISTMRNSWKNLLDDELGLLRKNYTVKRDAWIMPDFKKEKELAHIESRLDEAYT